MNIKGIKVDKNIIHLLKNTDLNIELIKNLDVFNSFTWKNFKKPKKIEFYEIINTLYNLTKDCDNLDDSQKFVIFFETDVTEMDAITIVKYKELPLVIDVEVKNGDEAELLEKLKIQLDKRKNDYMQQLFKQSNYLLIGVINGEIVYSLYQFDEETKEIDKTFVENILLNCKLFKDMETFLYEVNNIPSIVNIYRQIKEGTFKFSKDMSSKIDNIEKYLNDENKKCVFCPGDAGTGKSVAAFKLFNDFKNSKLLILNPKLFFALELNEYYMKEKTYYKTDLLLSNLKRTDILIVDEAQRLTKKQFNEIFEKVDKVVLLGDKRQVFMENEVMFNLKELKKISTKFNLKCYISRFNQSKRYSNNVNELINSLTDYKEIHADSTNSSNEKKKKPDASSKNAKTGKSESSIKERTEKINDFSIRILLDENEFIKQYDKINDIKRIYIPYTIHNKTKNITISDTKFDIAKWNENNFSVIDFNLSNKIGHTFHALSFDVNHSFVYLKGVKTVTVNKQTMLYHNEFEKDEIKIKKFMNELNILFSRGKKSLTILIDDISVYLYLKSKIKKYNLDTN